MPVHHRGRTGAAEPLQHEVAVHERVAAVAGVGRVAVLVRPLTGAGQAFGQMGFGIRRQPSHAVLRLQQSLHLVLGQAARRLAKPGRLGRDQVGKVISERQRVAGDEMHGNPAAIQPTLGQALPRRSDFSGVRAHADDAPLRLLRQRSAQTAVDHVGDQRPAALGSRHLGQALGQAKRQLGQLGFFDDRFLGGSGGKAIQRTGIGADQQPPGVERQAKRAPVDLGRPSHRAVPYRPRLNKPFPTKQDAISQGDYRPPARHVELPHRRLQSCAAGCVQCVPQLTQLPLQGGFLHCSETRFF